MPIDRETLKATITEAVNGDGELASLLEQKMLANDSLAASFVAGYMRNRDYTPKNEGLADERRPLQSQVEQYRSLLEAAEGEKSQVLKDLAAERMSVAQANARLKHIKSTYQMSDEDIPPFGDLIETATSHRPVDSS